jgi:hypothetical protein
MKTAILEMLSSKKFLAAMLAIVGWFAGLLGFNVDPAQLAAGLSPLLAYIIGQGIADHGKPAAKILATAAAATQAPAASTAPAIPKPLPPV